MTSTYDHRIIQGAESGQFLQVVEAYLQGEHGFYEQVFADLGATLGPAPQPPQPAAAAAAPPAAPPSPRRARAPQVRRRRRRRRDDAAGRAGRHLAAQGAPHARPPRREARPARLRARGRPGARPRAARPDAGDHGAGSRRRSCARTCRARRWPTRCRTCARPTAARSPTRSSTSPRTASACGCARRSSRAPSATPLTNEEEKALLRRLTQVDSLERFMHKAYLGQKQFSIEGLDMTVPMLDEMIQLVGRQRRARGRHRHGPPRPAQRARPQPRARLRDDLPRVRGRLLDRGRDHDPAGRHRRRQVPPRRPGHLPAARRRLDHRAAGVQPEPPRVRLAGRRGRHARGPDDAARARTRTSTPTPRSRSSCTATPPSRARAWSRRRSTCRRSTATPSAARCT